MLPERGFQERQCLLDNGLPTMNGDIKHSNHIPRHKRLDSPRKVRRSNSTPTRGSPRLQRKTSTPVFQTPPKEVPEIHHSSPRDTISLASSSNSSNGSSPRPKMEFPILNGSPKKLKPHGSPRTHYPAGSPKKVYPEMDKSPRRTLVDRMPPVVVDMRTIERTPRREVIHLPPDSPIKAKVPEKVKVGSLILGRGSVYQYATKYYIDRQQLPLQAWQYMLLECIPCTEGLIVSEPVVEAHPGREVHLKRYVEDVEHAIYENRHIDSIGKRKLWRLLTSNFLQFLLLTSAFMLSAVKCVADLNIYQKNWMTLFETKFALLAVLVRLVQTLIVYWNEREIRHNLEVTSWDDGTVTKGRPISLFILLWVYICLQIFVCGIIVFGSLSLSAMGMAQWTIITTGIPLFIISEFFSSILHRHLEMWRGRVTEDQLKLALLEATDLFEETWSKTRDSNVQNKVYTFKEAVTNAFHLDTLKLAYIRKQDPKKDIYKL